MPERPKTTVKKPKTLNKKIPEVPKKQHLPTTSDN